MLVKKLIAGHKIDLQHIEELDFLHIKGKILPEDLKEQKIDGIIIDDVDLLVDLRSQEELYLLPVFTSLELGNAPNTDGIFDPLSPSPILAKTRELHHYIKPYRKLSLPDEPDQRLLVKLARYLISRKIILEPERSRHSSLSYSYNLASDLSGERNPLRILKVLNDLSQQNYFSRDVVDKVNLCHECEGAFLNFSECCTQCGSLDLTSEDLVHHFRCAYVGPLSDFRKEDHMECPKCNHKLKHIGIDYDKPSEIHTCTTCNYSSQETAMKAKCVDCGHDNALNELSTYSINTYSPTDKARSKANEKFSIKEITVEEIGVDPDGVTAYPVYNILTMHERQKKDLYRNDIYVMNITLREKVMRYLNNHHKRNLLNELARITKPYLKDRDLITVTPSFGIECLLIDYKINEVKEMASIIEYNLDKMVHDNSLSDNKSISVHHHKLVEV
jgi:hypothetical protein